MSPSRSAARGLTLACAAFALAAVVPEPVSAHAIGGTFELPVPLWLYLVGAAAAVAASFAVIIRRPPRGTPEAPDRAATVPASAAAPAATLLRILGLAWWYGAIAVAFVVGGITPLPALLLWVGIWIALPIVAVLAGNPWPAMSPFRTTYAAIERIAGRRAGDAPPLRYPERAARWPAVALLGAAIWSELILPGSSGAGVIGALMLAYTLVTLLGMIAFGAGAWLTNVELFEVVLAWYGRIGPLDGRRVRGWFAGLRAARGLGWSDAAFVVLLLAGVTYDGLRETALGAAALGILLPPIQAAFGLTLVSFLLVETLALLGLYAVFLAAFALVVALTRALSDTPADDTRTAAAYAATLMPIAAGYVIAHYFTLVVQAIVWLPQLVIDPLSSVAPTIDWIPVSLVWYVSVVAIVGGHVVGVALAHRLTPARGRAAALAGLPMVALMVGYTVLSLWIIAQPIVIEPGSTLTEALSAPRADGI